MTRKRINMANSHEKALGNVLNLKDKHRMIPSSKKVGQEIRHKEDSKGGVGREIRSRIRK